MKRACLLLVMLGFVLGLGPSARAEEKGFFDMFKKEEKPPVQKSVSAPAAQAAVSKSAPAAPDTKAITIAALVNRMANNKTMTDAVKTDLAKAMAKHFSPDADVRAPEHEKDTLYFEQVANDPNMKPEEKKAMIEKYVPGPAPAKTEADAEARTEIKPEIKIPAVVEAKKPVVRNVHQGGARPLMSPVKKEAVIEKKEVPAAKAEIEEVKAEMAAPAQEVKTEVQEVKLEAKEVKETVKEEKKEEKVVKKASSNFAKKG